jgi:5'-3' exonuclease
MIKRPSRTVIYDVANLLFRVSAVQKATNPYARDTKPEDLVGLCMHISLQSIARWFYKFKPDFIVFAFEGKDNWRKTYTAETKTRLQYKANRVPDPGMGHYYELIDSFKETISAHTSVCCLHHDSMEGDDMIAGYCQLYAGTDHEIFIVSGDKDFTQLLKLPGVKLVNPDNGKLRNMPLDKDYTPDIDYWLFRKCVRGDMGDYVPSAFPRVRETRIKKAYESDYERVNLLNEMWIDENKVTHKVKDLFDQNVILLNLWSQPPEERAKLLIAVEEQTSQLSTYSHFHFLRFLEEFKLQKVRDEAMKFVDLFAHNQRFVRGEKLPQPEPVVEKEVTHSLPKSKLLEF